ncbi:hypothetical protein [Pseudoglutamicibacter cumminsii]|uniref:hypothetical protein n=1 Tax=Pseudoglutamicibacter cumminsii TaxID=156979 RepID=UPI00195E9CA7|nr:hypothetical protein [Pseudoglutamicibacter cumminsii]MBM7795294.1 hypothetical protein [Pseudoglutamicibacter cumminsii]
MDDIELFMNAFSSVNQDIGGLLWKRGWLADTNVADDEELSWFWPPTAPVGFGGLPEWSGRLAKLPAGTLPPRRTPWTKPTTLRKVNGAWHLEFGQAPQLEARETTKYSNEYDLLQDLKAIECWPLTVEENRDIRMHWLYQAMKAESRHDHYRTVRPTEPYATRIEELQEHVDWENDALEAARTGRELPAPPQRARPHGDVKAKLLMAEAESWASAVRTARVGGPGWSINNL